MARQCGCPVRLNLWMMGSKQTPLDIKIQIHFGSRGLPEPSFVVKEKPQQYPYGEWEKPIQYPYGEWENQYSIPTGSEKTLATATAIIETGKSQTDPTCKR